MTFNRSILFTTIGLLFAVLFVPFIVANNLFFPFITGKNFTFRIIVEIAALLWVVLMLRDSQYFPKLSWLNISVFSFVVIVGVADLFGSNPIKSFLSNFERMEGWITLVHLLLYFLMAATIFKKWLIWERFFQVSVGVSVIVSILGFMQLVGPNSIARIDGGFGNPTYLAVYMLFHVFITAILLSRWLKRKYFGLAWFQDPVIYIYLLAIVLQTAALFFTATRGSILGLIGGMIVAAILVAITERKSLVLRKISISILAVIVVIVGIFLLARNTDFVKKNDVLSRFSSISVSDNTTKARLMIWNMAWQGTTADSKHFLLGYGQEGFNYVFAKYYNPGMYAQEQWFDRSHDVVFDWLTQAGVLGLAAYLSMFVMTLYVLWRKSNFSSLEKSLITGLLLGYFFHNIFVFDNIVSYIMFFSVMAFVGAVANEPVEEPKDKHNKIQETVGKESIESMQYAGVILAIAAFIFVAYQYDYKPIAANRALINALTKTQIPAANGGQPQIVYTGANAQSFKDAIAFKTIGLYETREQLMEAAQRSLGDGSEDSVKQSLVSLAVSEINNQLQETPNDVRYYVLGGSFYQSIGDYNSAQKLLLQAQKFSPKKQSLLFLLGSNYFALKQYTEALTTLKQAYELDTTFDEAKAMYGLVALYVGQDKLTQSLFATTSPIMDPRFLQAYKVTKHYDLMLQYLENSVSKNPIDIQAQLSLADGYVIVGSVTKAVAVLQKVKTMTNDAGAQTQIDTWIKDVRAGNNPFEATATK